MPPLSHLPRAGLVSSLTVLLTLAACGGGSDSTSDGTDTVDPAGTLRGTVVVNGTVQNAVVCMDLNANETCDPDEPASAPTAANGSYLLRYDPASLSADRVAAASLIAPQRPGQPTDPATTIDTADGLVTSEHGGYVLKQVPGRAGQINPLTTMVAKGLADGMSEAEARENLALQLGIGADKIDSYLADPVPTDSAVPDNARTLAVVVAASMDRGYAVSVGRQSAALVARGRDLIRLQFDDTDNFNLREFAYTDKPEGPTRGEISDVRDGKRDGLALSGLYTQAYLGPDGWRLCDDTVPITFTMGTPSRSVFCGAQASVAARTTDALNGQTMGGFVTRLQTDPLNFINVGATANAGLLAALGPNAAFPEGSGVRRGFSLNLNQPVFINNVNTDAQPQSRATTLEQLVAARQTSGVDLRNSAGTLSLGAVSDGKALRVAFMGNTGPVQYYVCDANADFTVLSNCAAAAQGTFSIATEHGARVMRFTGHPETYMNNLRVYVEVNESTQAKPFVSGSRVYQARQLKPGLDFNLSESKRLNATAWAAMKTQLGL